MRALVTGAAGFIGSHLVERLLVDGCEVVGVDALTDYYDPAVKRANVARVLGDPGFSWRELDLAADDLGGLLDGVDVVYHLAGQPGVRLSFGAGFGTYVRENVVGTQRLLEACVGRRLQRFVYASSSSVYGHIEGAASEAGTVRAPVSPYGMTKAATEDICGVYFRNEGVPVVGLRYFTVYGPRQRPDMAFCRFIEAALEGRALPLYGDGRQLRDFTYVEDVVEATVAAGRHGRPDRVYNIGGGTPVELRAVFGLLGEVLERPVLIDRLPAAHGDARATCADGSRALAELGFRPRVGLEVGLARQVHAAVTARRTPFYAHAA
jgi:UDP-glucose 4-epimerase